MTSLNPVHRIGRQISEVLKLHTDASGNELKKQTVDILKRLEFRVQKKLLTNIPINFLAE